MEGFLRPLLDLVVLRRIVVERRGSDVVQHNPAAALPSKCEAEILEDGYYVRFHVITEANTIRAYRNGILQ